MRMTPEEFHIWTQRLQFPKEAEALITAIRSSPPVRRVTGRANNTTGRYPSPKMGVSIQFESEHVEFWAIYEMECDDDVLEYYDQASRIPLSYRAKSGRQTTQWHTPDFFVLRRASAGWEEWKPAQSLDQLAVSMPARYVLSGTGQWHCPPGEAYAQPLGLSYRVRSSAELHPLEIQNLKFLQDFWAHDVPPNPEQEALAAFHIQAYPGIALSELLATYPDLPVDVVFTLLAQRRVFTDLCAALLMHHDMVRLYAEEIQMQACHAISSATSQTSLHSQSLAWDGRLWIIEALTDVVQLRPEVGETLTLPRTEFEHLMQEGALWVVGEATPSPTTPEMRQILERASPAAQRSANERLKQMLAYARGEPTTASKRSLQRWWNAYQAAETQYGCGYLGLLDRVAQRGNRTPRIPDATMQLLEAHLQTHYAAPQAKSAAAVYRLYRRACEQQSLPPVSERTFYRVRARFSTPDVIAARRGRRAAYAEEPFYWLDQTTPRHGERPFALAHLDHTELDLLLVSSVTGKPLGKPWATFLTDAYSRRILACYVTYDPPSYRSVMMAFRECVKRHHRLPQECFVDRGPEFGSVYFETLLTRHFVAKKDRPAGTPRTGSVIERLFGTTTTQLLHQLLGNTQATKQPRQMTHEVDPRRLAVWTLSRFSARLCQYAYEVYDQMEHPALWQSPREAFTQGMQLAGLRTHRLIPYSEEFLLLTCPSTRTGYAKVVRARGIVVNGLRYWNPLMRSSRDAGTSVPVRYEPFDMSLAYAFVDGQWLRCTADAFFQVQGRSEREWQLFPAMRSIASMAKLSAEDRAQLDAFKAVTVKHAHLTRVDDQLSLWVEEHTDATHVLLCGPGGVGKSKALTVVAERFTREELDRFVIPILRLPPIPPDLGPYLRLDYYWQIIDALKEHLLVKELLGNVAHLIGAPKATRSKLGAIDWLKARGVAEQALIRARVKAVFVDEGHRLMQGDGSHSVDEQLEWLKSLSNRTKVLHVLAGPYALFGFRNTSGQLARRGRDIHFARYHVENKEERTAFVATLKYLLERVPLDVDLNALLSRWRWFAEGCVGCIGVLKDWLVDAVAATLAKSGTNLTEEILTKTMPHPARRVSLEMEARAGEHKVALHNSEGAKQFQALWKKPAKAAIGKTEPTPGSMPGMPSAGQADEIAELTSAAPPMPQVSPKPTQPRVGQRAIVRDPVGETSAFSVRKTAGCSFTEVIRVSPSQIEETGVSRFECPTCKAVRDIQPKGDRVKFPSHPKRTTTTPNHGKR